MFIKMKQGNQFITCLFNICQGSFLSEEIAVRNRKSKENFLIEKEMENNFLPILRDRSQKLESGYGIEEQLNLLPAVTVLKVQVLFSRLQVKREVPKHYFRNSISVSDHIQILFFFCHRRTQLQSDDLSLISDVKGRTTPTTPGKNPACTGRPGRGGTGK